MLLLRVLFSLLDACFSSPTRPTVPSILKSDRTGDRRLRKFCLRLLDCVTVSCFKTMLVSSITLTRSLLTTLSRTANRTTLSGLIRAAGVVSLCPSRRQRLSQVGHWHPCAAAQCRYRCADWSGARFEL